MFLLARLQSEKFSFILDQMMCLEGRHSNVIIPSIPDDDKTHFCVCVFLWDLMVKYKHYKKSF